MKYSQNVWLWTSLIFVTLVRFFVAAYMPLSPDEAYYWTWSKGMDYSFYDHPPMVAIWIKIGCWLAGDTALGVRLLGPFAALVGSIFVYFTTIDFSSNKAPQQKNAIYAVLLLNATLAIGVGSVIMTPDTPLLFFTCLFLWCCGRLIKTQAPQCWWFIGGSVGLALLSKYTALLPVMGLVVWCFCTAKGRSYLKSKELWGGAVVTGCLFSPVVWWNAHHQWVSFTKQGGRAADWNPHRAVQFLSELLGGQIGLSTPIIFICFCAGVFYLTRSVFYKKQDGAILLWLIVCIPACVFIQHAFGDRVQANWVGLLYPALAIITAIYVHRFLKLAVAVGALIILPVYIQAVAAPFSLPSKFDVTLKRLGGWQDFAQEISHVMPVGDHIVIDEYGLASELAFYLPQRKIITVDTRWKYFTFPENHSEYGYLIRTQRRKDAPSSRYFSNVETVGTIQRKRGNAVAEMYTIYKVQITPSSQIQHEVVQLP